MTILKTADELTTGWLSEALGAPVDAFSVAPVGTGQMGDSYRVQLHGVALPRSVILKVASRDETSRATGLALRAFEVEVSFYRQLASRVVARVPGCHFAEVEVTTGWFSLLLEDMSPAVQGDQLTGCTEVQAQQAMDELARLHACAWEDPELASLGWLNRTSPASTEFNATLIGALWPGFLERYSDDLTPMQREICERLMARLAAYLGDRSGPMTLIHGDYRLDNHLFDEAGLTIVDWQTAVWGPPMVDASYFLACAIADPDERAALEDPLIRRYHQGLLDQGVRGYDWDTCWRDYRRCTFTTLVMAIASSMLVQRTERGDQMFLCSIERACAQIDHLNALELLP